VSSRAKRHATLTEGGDSGASLLFGTDVVLVLVGEYLIASREFPHFLQKSADPHSSPIPTNHVDQVLANANRSTSSYLTTTTTNQPHQNWIISAFARP